MEEELKKIEKIIDKYNTELLMHIKVILCHVIKEAIELELDPINKYIYINNAYSELLNDLVDYTGNDGVLSRDMKDEIYDMILPFEEEAKNQIYDIIDELYNKYAVDTLEFDKKYQELLEILKNMSTGEGIDAIHEIPIKPRGNKYIKK